MYTFLYVSLMVIKKAKTYGTHTKEKQKGV